MNKTSRLIKLTIILAFIGVVGYFMSGYFLGGDISINLKEIDMNNGQIFIDDKAQGLYGYNEKNSTVRLNNVFGKKKIKINSAGYYPYTQEVAVWLRGTKTLEPELKAKPALEDARELAKEIDSSPESVNSAVIAKNEATGLLELRFNLNSGGKDVPLVALYSGLDGRWFLSDGDD